MYIVGYIYANGVSEAIVGLSMSLAGLTGLIGSVLFPPFRKRIGLERTGLFAFNLEVFFLVLCVLSVWLPGTVFFPFGYEHSLNNCSVWDNTTTTSLLETTATVFYQSWTFTTASPEQNYSDIATLSSPSEQSYSDVTTHLNMNTSVINSITTDPNPCEKNGSGLNISIICFLVGIILSRIGMKF